MGKVIKWILGIAVALVAALLILMCVYLGREWNRTTFFNHSTINGFDVSELTPDEVQPVLEEAFTAATVHLTEQDKTEAIWSLADLGYTIDRTALKAGLEAALEKQKSSIPVLIDSLMNGNSFEVEVPFTSDASRLSSAVTVSALADARILNVNAELVYDEAARNYSISPEVQGTELNDADLRSLVQGAVEGVLGGTKPQGDITVAIPSDLYIVPEVLSTDAELNMYMNGYNAFDKAVITYVYGDQKEELNWDTVKDWVFFENGQAYLSEERLREYVMNIGVRYNTIYYTRTFTTTAGNQIEIPENENNYGYLVDESGEYEQLLADIQANTATEREPVYAYSGLRRSGRDDLVGTYVEVSLGMQHMWFYKDYSLIVESDIVSGCIAKNAATQTGVFPIAYKESPATLIPSNETNGTPVQYWMPFFDGQGLHDASWRTAFGGQIYQTNGSHGCVNLPPYAAETIFNNVDTGTAVILY